MPVRHVCGMQKTIGSFLLPHRFQGLNSSVKLGSICFNHCAISPYPSLLLHTHNHFVVQWHRSLASCAPMAVYLLVLPGSFVAFLSVMENYLELDVIMLAFSGVDSLACQTWTFLMMCLKGNPKQWGLPPCPLICTNRTQTPVFTERKKI